VADRDRGGTQHRRDRDPRFRWRRDLHLPVDHVTADGGDRPIEIAEAWAVRKAAFGIEAEVKIEPFSTTTSVTRPHPPTEEIEEGKGAVTIRFNDARAGAGRAHRPNVQPACGADGASTRRYRVALTPAPRARGARFPGRSHANRAVM
jgi:hypothetical protein